MSDDIKLPISVDAAAALKNLEAFSKRAEKTLGELEKNMGKTKVALKETTSQMSKDFDAVKVAAAGVAAVFAGREVINFFREGIDAALKQEAAMASLGQQMKLTGDFSQEALDDFAAFADQMEMTSKYGDDVVLSQVAVAKSFGLTNDEARDLTKAAIELSAATGINLETAVKQLGNTYSGVTGKLDEQIPALKGLSKEALASGEAIKTVLSRFGGSSEAEVKTFGGAVRQASNAFGNLQEAFGEIIVKNPAVIAAIRSVTEIMNGLRHSVEGNSEDIGGALTGALTDMLEVLPDTIRAFDIFGKAVVTLAEGTPLKVIFDGITKITGGLESGKGIALSAAEAYVKLAQGILQVYRAATIVPGTIQKILGFEPIAETIGLNAAIDQLGALDDRIDALQSGDRGLSNIIGGSGELEPAARAVEKIVNQLKEGQKVGPLKILPGGGGGGGRGGGDTTTGGETGIVNFGADRSLREISAEQIRAHEAQLAAIYHDMGLGQLWRDTDWNNFSSQLSSRLSTAASEIGNSFFSNMGGGKDGANAFVASVGGSIAEVFAPGAGGAVAQALQMLGQDPEAFRAAIDGFVQGIPEIIDNIVLNIPYLVEAIADNSGEIITALVAATPRIAVALAEAMPVVAQSLLNELVSGIQYQMEHIMGNGASAFQTGMRDGALDFIYSMGDAGIVFYNAVIDAGNALIDALWPGGGSSENSSTYGQVTGDSDDNPFNGINLYGGSSGSSAETLSTFSSGRTSPAASATDVLLARVIQLLEQPMQVTATATVSGQAFADVVLDLTRRNARLYA